MVVVSAQVAAMEDSVVRALDAEVTPVASPVAGGSTVEVAEGVTSMIDPLENEWYGAGGGGGGPAGPDGPDGGGGGASPLEPDGGGGGEAGPGGGGGAAFPGAGGSAEAETRPRPSTRVAIAETIFSIERCIV